MIVRKASSTITSVHYKETNVVKLVLPHNDDSFQVTPGPKFAVVSTVRSTIKHQDPAAKAQKG